MINGLNLKRSPNREIYKKCTQKIIINVMLLHLLDEILRLQKP